MLETETNANAHLGLGALALVLALVLWRSAILQKQKGDGRSKMMSFELVVLVAQCSQSGDNLATLIRHAS